MLKHSKGVSHLTLQELSQQIKLRERLERDKIILNSLQEAACLGAQVLTGMPHTPGVRDKVGDLAIEIADMKERVRYLETEIKAKDKAVSDFVFGIEDARLQMIFRLRFIRCLTWQRTAEILGVDYTEDKVKKLCYRYLDMA